LSIKESVAYSLFVYFPAFELAAMQSKGDLRKNNAKSIFTSDLSSAKMASTL
jgi:hypothetical protein